MSRSIHCWVLELAGWCAAGNDAGRRWRRRR